LADAQTPVFVQREVPVTRNILYGERAVVAHYNRCHLRSWATVKPGNQQGPFSSFPAASGVGRMAGSKLPVGAAEPPRAARHPEMFSVTRVFSTVTGPHFSKYARLRPSPRRTIGHRPTLSPRR
jgi:hypothetical protein